MINETWSQWKVKGNYNWVRYSISETNYWENEGYVPWERWVTFWLHLTAQSNCSQGIQRRSMLGKESQKKHVLFTVLPKLSPRLAISRNFGNFFTLKKKVSKSPIWAMPKRKSVFLWGSFLPMKIQFYFMRSNKEKKKKNVFFTNVS